MERPWFKHYDPGVPKDIEYPEIPLWRLLEQSANRYPEQVALEFLGKTLSYKELWEAARRFAEALRAQGVQPGERVAIMLPNTPAFVIAFYGTLMAGGIAVNVNPLYTPRELHHQLVDAGAETLVMLDILWPRYAEIAGEVPLRRVITSGIQDYLPFPKNLLYPIKMRREKRWVNLPKDPKRHDLKTLLRSYSPIAEPVNSNPDDIALLQYTGGTTGISKGAMLTHRNLVANMQQASAWVGGNVRLGEELIVTALPLYHIFALTANCLVFIKFGARNLLITNPRDMPGFVKELKHSGFTAITGVNTLFNGLLNTPGFEQVDFSKLHLTLGGGMAVQRAVAEKWKKVTGVTLAEAYGLTETSPAVCINPLDLPEYNGSIGLPVPSTDVCIKDDNGNILPVGEIGELCVKGPQVMKGYWKRPDETAKVIDADGWLHTGDMARMDEKGYFYLVDRKKDMILVSGFNVYPNEVEDVIAMMPGVLEVAAIGVPDEKSGEAVKVFIVKKDPALTAEDVKAFCRENLTGYKQPRYVEFRNELPKSNVGKILRKELRQQSQG